MIDQLQIHSTENFYSSELIRFSFMDSFSFDGPEQNYWLTEKERVILFSPLNFESHKRDAANYLSTTNYIPRRPRYSFKNGIGCPLLPLIFYFGSRDRSWFNPHNEYMKHGEILIIIILGKVRLKPINLIHPAGKKNARKVDSLLIISLKSSLIFNS